MKLTAFWFRSDLRLSDNVALYHALKNKSGNPVLPVFIFDTQILNELPKNDARVSFIHKTLLQLNAQLTKLGSSLLCLKGDVQSVWAKLIHDFEIEHVFINKDYEPYAIDRDGKIEQLLQSHSIQFYQYKDQVIFEENEILKADQTSRFLSLVQWHNGLPDGRCGHERIESNGLHAQSGAHGYGKFFVQTFAHRLALGQAYFAKKLLDYELSANNGNWQWSAGTGCDAAPYFRVFNPAEQQKKFDAQWVYIRKWIPENRYFGLCAAHS